MCDICLQFPCNSRCPNAPEPKTVFVCSGCSGDIYEGEDYWDIMGEQFCEHCMDNARHTAEYIPEEGEELDYDSH